MIPKAVKIPSRDPFVISTPETIDVGGLPELVDVRPGLRPLRRGKGIGDVQIENLVRKTKVANSLDDLKTD
jgi:hypothetical protein